MPGEGDAVTEKNGSGGGDLLTSLEAAWGLRDRPAKGPKPGLSLERIVAAAVGVAASDGLAAVSMGRVAQELGASTMSLYRYVSAKDELYVLMQEAAVGPPEPLSALEAGCGLAGRAHRMGVRAARALPRPPLGPPDPHRRPARDPELDRLVGAGAPGAGGQRSR